MGFFYIITFFFAVINIIYLVAKDNINRGEQDKQECVNILKAALEYAMEHYNKNRKNKNLNCIHICAYLESLLYLRLARENKIDHAILEFSTAIDDFIQRQLSFEELIGKYKTAIEAVYTMKYSLKKYIMFILKDPFEFLASRLKRMYGRITKR